MFFISVINFFIIFFIKKRDPIDYTLNNSIYYMMVLWRFWNEKTMTNQSKHKALFRKNLDHQSKEPKIIDKILLSNNHIILALSLTTLTCVIILLDIS